MRLEFDHLPVGKSLNSRAHWSKRVDAAQVARGAVALQRGNFPRLREPIASARLHLHYFLPSHRRRDLDNLVASTKPYIDQLVREGVLADDCWPVIQELRASASYRPQEPGFVLILTAVGHSW